MSFFADISGFYAKDWTRRYNEYSFKFGKYLFDYQKFKFALSAGISYISSTNNDQFINRVDYDGSGSHSFYSAPNPDRSGIMFPLQFNLYTFLYKNLGLGFKYNHNFNFLEKDIPPRESLIIYLAIRIPVNNYYTIEYVILFEILEKQIFSNDIYHLFSSDDS